MILCGSNLPRSSWGIGILTLSPTYTGANIRLLLFTMRSACIIWTSFAVSESLLDKRETCSTRTFTVTSSDVAGEMGGFVGSYTKESVAVVTCSTSSSGTGNVMAASRSSSDCNRWRISGGRLDDDRPVRSPEPNSAANGEHLIPLWRNLSPTVHSVVLLSPDQQPSMSLISQSALSTDPRLCGCLSFPWTITNSGHITFSSVITWAVNSEPLSLCSTQGAPNRRNMSSSWNSTSAARFDVKGRKTQKFLRWSW